jgi:hypothetical protein
MHGACSAPCTNCCRNATVSRRVPLAFVAVPSAAVVAAIAILLPPIPQPRRYHDFADQRAFLGIPNFLDVVSNTPFLLIFAVALARPTSGRITLARDSEHRPYLVFFLGILLTAFTSAWYHLAPGNG